MRIDLADCTLKKKNAKTESIIFFIIILIDE